ncbi:hypothetical protein J6590_033379 [Homalodisca vitripennis]|nr:hypothetical protein J6590_033379 [Homalodisca vitripennis]
MHIGRGLALTLRKRLDKVQDACWQRLCPSSEKGAGQVSECIIVEALGLVVPALKESLDKAQDVCWQRLCPSSEKEARQVSECILVDVLPYRRKRGIKCDCDKLVLRCGGSRARADSCCTRRPGMLWTPAGTIDRIHPPNPPLTPRPASSRPLPLPRRHLHPTPYYSLLQLKDPPRCPNK